MTVFADSSALVKIYADEEGATVVRRHRAFVISAIARVEVTAALWGKHRAGSLPAEDAAVLAAEFAADWHQQEGPFVPVVVSAPLIERAVTLVATHGLRGYDSVQLACALAAREADPQVDAFLCFDADLSSAARREGFQLLG